MSSEAKKHARGNSVTSFVGASYQELRKVTWPTRNKAVRLTFLVLGFCLVTAIFIGVLDYVFGTGHRSLLDLGPARTLPVSADTAAQPTIDLGEATVTTEDGSGVLKTVSIGPEEVAPASPEGTAPADDAPVTQ